MKDFDRETSAKIHLAICLLDRGELKEAIETYFKPLMVFKSNMSYYTRVLYLQYYGNACRSAADWGRAKEYLREALDLAKEVRDAGLVSSCCGDLGNVFRSEGRYGLIRCDVCSTKLNARLALRQRADLFKANISANEISLPQGQSSGLEEG